MKNELILNKFILKLKLIWFSFMLMYLALYSCEIKKPLRTKLDVD